MIAAPGDENGPQNTAHCPLLTAHYFHDKKKPPPAKEAALSDFLHRHYPDQVQRSDPLEHRRIPLSLVQPKLPYAGTPIEINHTACV